MPLYDYRCTQCGKITEVRHGFDDAYAEPCAACGATLARVFNPAPILFKGSGFYVTDSRKASSSANESAPATASPASPAASAAPAAASSTTPASAPAASSDSAA